MLLVNDWMLNAFSSCCDFNSVTPIQATKSEVDVGCGYGRIVRVKEPISVHEACEMIKAHFGLKYGK